MSVPYSYGVVDVVDVVTGGRAKDPADTDWAWSTVLHESVDPRLSVRPRQTRGTSRPQTRQHAHQRHHDGEDRWLWTRDQDWVSRREEDVSSDVEVMLSWWLTDVWSMFHLHWCSVLIDTRITVNMVNVVLFVVKRRLHCLTVAVGEM